MKQLAAPSGTIPSTMHFEPGKEREPDFIPSIDLRTPSDPPWTGWNVLQIAALTFVAILVLSFAAFGIAKGIPGLKAIPTQDLARDPRILIPVQLLAYIVVLLYMYTLAHRVHRQFWKTVRWNWPYATWFSYIIGGVGLALLIQLSSGFLPIPRQLPIERFFKTPTSAYLMAIFGITAAPLVEELFFRGFLFPVVVRRLGMISGVGITAGLFALIHQSQLGYAWAPLLLLFIVGLVLTLVRARTGSVASSFLIHVGYNTTLFVLLYVSTDHFRHLEKMVQAG